MNLGIVVRGDKSGLGFQTRNLTYMLRPHKIMYVDSKPFNGHDQHPEWYDGFSGVKTIGFPSERECRHFLRGLDAVLMCENPYNYALLRLAQAQGTRTYVQYNYEFLEWHRIPNLPIPTKFLSPSYWFLEEMVEKYPNTVYLPPPIFMNDFKAPREVNMGRSGKRRFLHIIGKLAHGDRNGTVSVIEALQHTDADFELVIKCQHPVEQIHDDRVTYHIDNPEDQAELYMDFDAMILPRRYAGLCLPMNEALASGLPVIMTDISPNDRALPNDWLVPAKKIDSFQARTQIDIYNADPKALAAMFDKLCDMKYDDLLEWKATALDIAADNYSSDVLRPRYEEVCI